MYMQLIMYYLFQIQSACNLSVSLRVLFSPGHKNVVGDFSGVGQKLFVYIFASLPELRWRLPCLLRISRCVSPENGVLVSCNRSR